MVLYNNDVHFLGHWDINIVINKQQLTMSKYINIYKTLLVVYVVLGAGISGEKD